MKETRIGTPFTVHGFTIIPLEEVSVVHESRPKGFRAHLSMEPVGIVVTSDRGGWALDVRGEEVELEAFIEKVPGLREFLDKSSA
jgi:hypothetical protein